jgi:hypothetical protein
MMRKSSLAVLTVLALSVLAGQSVMAQDEWKFGIGTGLSSLSLDGDIGFATSDGPLIADLDLDNSETSDLVKSGFGLGGFATKGKWTILYSLGRLTLEDDDKNIEAEWDRDSIELSGVYNFAKTGNHNWGVLFGMRYIGHEWEFDLPKSSTLEVDESWTDGLVGFTHALSFAGNWAWANRLDASFGDSEGGFLISTGLNWQVADHWNLNLSLKQHAIEFGEKEDRSKSDFYLYDVDEMSLGIGFMYTW